MAVNSKNSATAKKMTSGSSKTAVTKAAASKPSKSRGKSASSTKKSKTGSNRRKPPLAANPYEDEIIAIITLVVTILFALSTFDLCGVFGQWVSYVLFGVFGVFAYLIPYLLFLGVVFGISNRGNRSVQMKIGYCVGVYVVAVSLAHMMTHGYKEEAELLTFYTESAVAKSGGGILGAVVGRGLSFVFGQVGCYVILIGVAIGLLILITEKLLFAGIREQSIRSKEIFDAKREAHREERELYREQRALERAERAERAKQKVYDFSKVEKELTPRTQFHVFGEKKTLDTIVNKEIENNPIVLVDTKPSVANMDDLTISRGIDVLEEMTITKESVPENEPVSVFQEELEQKFKNSSNVQTISPVYVEEWNEEPVKEWEEESEEDSFFENAEKEQEEETDLEDLHTEAAENWSSEEVFVEEEKAFELDETDLEGREVLKQLNESEPEYSEMASGSFESGVSESDESTYSESVYIEKEAEEEIKSSKETKLKEKQPAEKENTKEEIAKVETEIAEAVKIEKPEHIFPPMDLLARPTGNEQVMSDQELKNTAMKLQSTLESFGVRVEMKNVSCGPTVTRYELQPAQGVKVSKITALTDDIKLSLAAADIRIEAPIPGKSAVGIEVPNTHNSMVYLRSLLESPEFKEHKSNLALAVGKDIAGKTIVADIAKMPHLLIAGATGSGKSVFINTLIMSILYKAHPDDVKLIMVDPKVVELSIYNKIPHLLIPVVTDPKKASGALNWAVAEMMDRYHKFEEIGVKELKTYNEKISVVEESNDERFKKLPQIVIIVDELADLMMVAAGEVEDAICRLTQLARACGIHLVIATQRPSVNVITGVIKANIPSRVAFSVSSAVDSRTILDGSGAEKLLGNGDMLFFPSGVPKPVRVQGAFISEKEVGAVVDFLKEQNGTVQYSDEIANKITTAVTSDTGQVAGNNRDEHFIEAGKFVIERDKASIGVIQRVFKVGYNRAARIMDQLYDAGVVGPEEGTKPRKVIMSMEQFEEYIDEYV